MSQSAVDLFNEGRLADAITAMGAEVRSHPADIAARSLLVELLCVAGDLQRADAQLAALADQDPATAVQIATLRQFIRADMARAQVWGEGRTPELLDAPPPHLALRLEGLMHLRAGRVSEAIQALADAEEARPALSGHHDGVAFDDFRDLDDLTAGVLEVLASTGKYFWVPMERVELIAFRAPARIIDGTWRAAEISVRGGPEGEVIIPAIYPFAPARERQAAALGRETEWHEIGPDCMRGEGLRCFLAGEESLTVLELGRLEFETP